MARLPVRCVLWAAMLGMAALMLVWIAVFHLLAFGFIPLFIAVDWLRPARRESARRTWRFLVTHRPVFRWPVLASKAGDPRAS